MKGDGRSNPYLVIWKDKRISYDNIFPSRCIEYHDFGNIIRSEWFAAAAEKLASCGLANGNIPTHRPRLLWLYRHKTVRRKTRSPLGLDLLPSLLSS